MNTLTTPFVTAVMADGSRPLLTLPGAFAALMRGGVVCFTALRPHQRHAWHAFLAQLAAVALLRAGLAAPPAEKETWRDLLRALTPDHPDAESWRLTAPPDRPSLLQAPAPDGLAALRSRIELPDGLDMLVELAIMPGV